LAPEAKNAGSEEKAKRENAAEARERRSQ